MEAFDPIVVKIKGDLGDLIAAFAAAKKAEEEFRATSKRTGEGVSSDMRSAGKATDEFGRLVTTNMRDGKSALESLRLKSTDLRTEIGRLRTEFAQTGSKTTFGNLQQAEGDFKKITSYIKDMEGNTTNLAPRMRQFNKAGADSLNIFEELQGSITSAMDPRLIAIGVAALAPLLGAVAGGTVLSLLAGGGLAAGITSQLGSMPVELALGRFEQEVMGAWQGATGQFGPELVSAIGTLSQYLAPVMDDLGRAFSHFAPVVSQLGNILGGSLRDLGMDLADDFGEMGPIFNALETALPVIIHGVAEFFNDIADQAPAIADDIITLAHGFETLMDVTGKIVAGLSATFAGMHALYQIATGDLAGFVSTLHAAQGGADQAVTSFGVFMGAEQQVGEATDGVTAALLRNVAAQQKVFDMNMALDNSQVAMYQSINDLRDALKQNKGAWDITTRAGEAHRLALLRSISATEQFYLDQVKVNGVTPALAAAYKTQIDSLLALAGQAGLSSDQVAALKTQFDNLITVMSKANGKPITIPVRVRYQVPALPSVPQIIARRSHANSGVFDPSAAHYDRSGVYPGRPGGYYMGEASTGQEALIGKYSDPGRAFGAIVTAAGWHGLAVAPARGGTTTGADYGAFGGGGSGPGSVMADVYLDADKVGYAMIKWSGRFQGRSGVTIAGATAGTTIGQAR